jgi:hypothetical protein
VFALPVFILGALGVSWNIFMNVEFNHFWAGGNIVLFLNTMFSFFQYFFASILVFEVDEWLRHCKFLRMLALQGAVAYTAVYWAGMYQLVVNTHGWTEEEPGFMQVYFVIFVAYNLILNVGTEFSNLVIIIKEISIEYFQFLRDDAGHETDDVSLGLHDWYFLGRAIMELFNPFWWFGNDSWIYE